MRFVERKKPHLTTVFNIESINGEKKYAHPNP
jgi:hypothetical protein